MHGPPDHQSVRTHKCAHASTHACTCVRTLYKRLNSVRPVMGPRNDWVMFGVCFRSVYLALRQKFILGTGAGGEPQTVLSSFMSSQLENIPKTVYIVHFRLRVIKAYTPGVYANLEAFTKEGFYNWDGSTGQSETGLSRTVTV